MLHGHNGREFTKLFVRLHIVDSCFFCVAISEWFWEWPIWLWRRIGFLVQGSALLIDSLQVYDNL